MNALHWKDIVLYFITANTFLFLTIHADNESVLIPLGIMLIGLLFIYLIRMNKPIDS